VPTVVVGLGKPGVMLTVLGRKMGAPWAFAALERGMEAYPEQPTVRDLRDVYHYDAIDRKTKLTGVTGFGEREYLTVALLNAAFARLGLAVRCLPLEIGSMRLFRKVLDAIKLPAVVVDEGHQDTIRDVVTEAESNVDRAGAADLLVHQGEKWQGWYLRHRAAVDALEAVLRSRGGGDKPLEGRTVMVVGATGLARVLGQRIVKRGGILILASRDRTAVQQLAQELQCRHVQYEAVYSTLHDVLVVCSDEQRAATAGRSREAGLHAGYLKPGMTVMDLTEGPRPSALLREAQQRGCGVVLPQQVLLEQTARQVRLIAGKETPREPLQETLHNLLPDEE